jgi:hypothetical protein
MTQWVPLAKALAHVARCVGSEPLARVLLMRKLADIPTRGYAIYQQSEGMEEPLPPELWTPYEGAWPVLDWQEQTATLTGGWHPYGPCRVFGIEVDWQALRNAFPASQSISPAQPSKGRGRKEKDPTAIIQAAEAVEQKEGLPRTVNDLKTRVKDVLGGEQFFGEGLLQRTLSAWLKHRRAEKAQSLIGNYGITKN